MTDKLSYQDASNWAKENNVKTTGQWLALSHKNMLPENLPKNPNLAYKGQWKGWSAFLQNGRRPSCRTTATYEECQKWAQDNNIQTAKQWYNLKDKLPNSMPTAPEKAFENVWKSWPDFLGNNAYSGVSIIERVTRLVLDSIFDPEAEEHRKQSEMGASGKKYMVDMLYPNIKLIVEYDGQFYHLDKDEQDIAKTQDLQNAGWNVVRIREGKLKKLNPVWDVHVTKYKYEEDKVKVILTHIKSLIDRGLLQGTTSQTKKIEKLIGNLDLHPFYQKIGVYNEFVSYEECQKWALARNITGEAQWRTFKDAMEEDKIPYHPERIYKNNGWVNWPTFLENGQRSKKENWASYEDASKWAQQNKVKSAREWYRLGDRRPSNMPTAPENTYKDQWVNWPTFLNNGKRARGVYLSYEEASLWAKANGITKGTQWYAMKKKPENIPSYPDNVYIEEWAGWAEFLGVERYKGSKSSGVKRVRKRVTERKFNFVSYEECAIWAKNNGVETSKDWKKIKNRPSNIPSDPPMAYKKVWVSWPEFFKPGRNV